jgi:hypothetical protein
MEVYYMKFNLCCLAVLGVSMSMTSQANCVEGLTTKLMSHNLSIDKGFLYSHAQLEEWVHDKLENGFSLHFGESSYNKHLLMLEREDYEEEFESFICEIKNGIQFVVRRYNDHSWRQTYKFHCDEKVSIKTKYDGVYPVAAIAFCK